MTDADLDAIEARCAAATPGEWTWEDGPPTVYSDRTCHRHGLNLFGRLEPDANGPANLEFICHARDDVPALVAEVKRLRKALLDLYVASLNEMTARNLPHEWQADSPMGRAQRLLEGPT